ncbi:MAG TPA: hypothetical protein VFY03_09705, partial [Woeseiaceae bacterium]|nr:hypothetical protein [Woeseiaceae bacterium]
MFARYVCAISTGTAMTFALLYVMQVLISFQQPANDAAARPHFFLKPVRIVNTPPPPPERQEFDELKEPLPTTPGRRGPTVPVEPVARLPGIPAGPGIPRT